MNSPLDGFLPGLHRGCARVRLQNDRCLVAVSGGADSVALLLGLVRLQNARHDNLIVAHFDHCLRGAESAADAAWVRQLAHRLNVPCRIRAARPAVVSSRDNLAAFAEAAARKQRYAFLLHTAIEERCSVIATAHTADDQAETVLHHLLRGTGLAGLRGIPWERELAPFDAPPWRCRVVRPMLAITRQEVLKFLQELGQDYREDRTNADLALTRNWLRHVVLPQLRQRFPQAAQSLCRLAQQSDEAQETLSQLATKLLETALVDSHNATVWLSVAAFRDQPRHLVRQVFVELWERQGWPLQRMNYDQWNQLASLVERDGGCHLPGAIEARRRGQLLILQRPTGG